MVYLNIRIFLGGAVTFLHIQSFLFWYKQEGFNDLIFGH